MSSELRDILQAKQARLRSTQTELHEIKQHVLAITPLSNLRVSAKVSIITLKVATPMEANELRLHSETILRRIRRGYPQYTELRVHIKP